MPVPRAESAAPAIHVRLEADDLQVTSTPTSRGKVELSAKRVEAMTLTFASALVKPDHPRQVEVQRAVVVEGESDGAPLDTLRLGMGLAMVPGNHDVARPRWLWLPVFEVRTFTRTGAELFVLDDGDASRQLDVLAPALGKARDAITIRPRPVWCGYGHPALRRYGRDVGGARVLGIRFESRRYARQSCWAMWNDPSVELVDIEVDPLTPHIPELREAADILGYDLPDDDLL